MKVCYNKQTYCGHPSQCGLHNFGGGEIAMIHNHGSCAYEDAEDVSHGSYFLDGAVLLQRSFDHGATWKQNDSQVIWDNAWSDKKKKKIHDQATKPSIEREEIDLSSPDAIVFFKRSKTGGLDSQGNENIETFAFRSADRGHIWEKVPTRFSTPPGFSSVLVDGYPPVQFPDRTQAVVADLDQSTLAFYVTDSNGLAWHYITIVARDENQRFGRYAYQRLLRLPSGRLQCYMVHLAGTRCQTLEMNYSDDGGFSWSTPKPIVRWGESPWTKLPLDQVWKESIAGPFYRSPWPLQLADGRIAVIFARRKRPFGMGLILSEDQGATWSAESVIRADASDWDIGYPVATQLDDDRIFTAYYYMENDGNKFGGSRYIAGSFFAL